MTTPGGVPNLPVGALTLDTLAAKLQDMSGTAMKSRAVERFPSIMDGSTGLSPASDLTPFGILTRIFSEVMALLANADPADIQGPEDIPPLLLEFIEGLPVVGQFVDLLEAIIGNYTGSDQVLLTVQALFAPIRALVLLIPGLNQLLALVGLGGGTGGGGTGGAPGSNPLDALFGALNQTWSNFGSLLQTLFGQSTQQAQINNLGTTGGFIHDFVTGVGGWTNLVGTLALSSRGSFVQSPSEVVAYKASGIAADKYGFQVVVNPSMRGVGRAGICAPSDGSSGADVEVYRGFDGDALRLVTRGSPTLTIVQKQVDFVGPARLNDLTALDVRTDGISKFWILRNGQPVLDWVDTAGVVTHNSTTRGVLLTSNGNNRNDDGFYGPAFQGKAITYGTW